jgi:hypothetical protein
VREALLIRHHPLEDETELALVLCDRALETARRSMRSGLAAEAFDAVALVVEGISHFVYFTHCGQQDRPVSRMELELQAEIDKFLVLWTWFDVHPATAREALFERFSLRDGLSEAEVTRYRIANREARRYALWVTRAASRGDGHRALSHARRLYRAPLPTKLAQIAAPGP